MNGLVILTAVCLVIIILNLPNYLQGNIRYPIGNRLIETIEEIIRNIKILKKELKMNDEPLRIVRIFDADKSKWLIGRLKNIDKGDVFQMNEDDGEQVYWDGYRYFIAVKDPFWGEETLEVESLKVIFEDKKEYYDEGEVDKDLKVIIEEDNDGECKWCETGYCENPQARSKGEICDIEPSDCQEDGKELIEDK